MQKTKEFQKSQSIPEKTEAIPTVSQEPKRKAIQSLKLCLSTRDLTCYDFWTMLCDGDLTKLILNPPEEIEYFDDEELKDKLDQRWLELQMESAEQRNPNILSDNVNILEVEQTLAYKQALDAAILYLKCYYHEGLIDKLREIFDLPLNWNDPFQFQRDINRCTAISKTWIFEMDTVISEFNRIYGPDPNAQKVKITYQILYSTLAPMGRYLNSHINPREYSVMEYDLIYREMMVLAANNKQ